jgi:hypothetical protein
MLDLDAIEARAEVTTPEPWTTRLRDDMARTDVPALITELRAAREVVEAAQEAATLRRAPRLSGAFYGALNRLEDALAAYRAVVGEA